METISRHTRVLLVLLALVAGGAMGIGPDSAGASASHSAVSLEEREAVSQTPDRGQRVADDKAGTSSDGPVAASTCRYGTSGGVHSACISFSTVSGGTLYPDFYIEDPPSQVIDCGYFTARMRLYVNGRVVREVWYDNIRSTGRYGPISHGVNAEPDRSSSAYNVVDLWGCSSRYRGNAVSATVRYVA